MTRSISRTHAEDGFTLIEVVIAMFLLAILALALIPSLVSYLKTSTLNSHVATATQLVNQQLESARVLPQTCSALQGWAGTGIGAQSVDGTTFQPSRSAVTCPATYPGTAKVHVEVSINGAHPVKGDTLVFLAAAS
jgi:prepilin-type N-terminal cleavage/methylation domain-containing protein